MIRERENPALETPMMRQYFSMKEKYAKEILFFRMGDFYEMFFDDAREAADILGIALTSRAKDKDAIPMAGVPVRAIDSYLPKLLKAGRRVAICEQLQDPKDARGLVERDVVRVISPGTITDEKLIGEKRHNYIGAVAALNGGFGFSWLDVTTGQFMLWESTSQSAIGAQISRVEPAECLLPEELAFQLESYPELKNALQSTVVTPYPDPLFEHQTAHRCLTEHFRTRTLEGFGCESLVSAVGAAGGLLSYVTETQKASLGHISKCAAYSAARHMPVDRATRVALELTQTQRGEEGQGTLLHTLDFTRTAMGGRLLREWLLAPLTDLEAILDRQGTVAELVAAEEARTRLRELLREVHDLERLCTRLSYRSATARDLLALRRTLETIPRIREIVAAEGQSQLLRECLVRLAIPEDLAPELARAIVDAPPLSVKDGGMIRPGYDRELDETREISTQGTRWLAQFQEEEIRRVGIPSLKVGFNQVFGYYLEVTNTHREKIPPGYIRKQTLKNCERFITPELKDYEARVLTAKDRAMALELEIFSRLRDEAGRHIQTFQTAAQALAELDACLSLAEAAVERGYVRPTVNDSLRLCIEDGRHPVVEVFTGARNFVANSVDLDADRSIMLITGPNMAGKSTYIRQVAVLSLMAQIGSFVPAKRAELGLIDRIFTRVGAADDLTRGQSTFMVEMNETANILNNATQRSLIILDEVGRGTSTFDGVSLAWAITEHLARSIGARTLFATHYHELTALADGLPVVRNFNFAVKEWNEDIIFLRKVVAGGTDKSYGIHVARLAGIPRPLLERARELLTTLESQAADLSEHLSPPGSTEVQPSTGKATGARQQTGTAALRQLDLFHDTNDKLLKGLKKLDLDRMTPLEALQYLADLKKRIV
jgi:DNA mismatch repair protein MutS